MGSSPTATTMDEEEAILLIQNLLDNGWYFTSIRFEGLESECSEEVTLVGNNKVWQ